jgi:hypothetical protein
MNRQLSLTIQGKLGHIPFSTFATMARNSCDILEELDSAVSQRPRGSLEWFISGVSTLASVTITVEPRSHVKGVDHSPKVAELFVNGWDHIQKEHTTPPYFSDYSLRKTQSIAKALRKNGAEAIKVEDIQHQTSGLIRAEVAEGIGQLISVRYQEVGSVEGRLEMISIHGTPRVTLYHSITRRSVSCKFGTGLLETAKEGLGKRVIVHGTVYLNYVHEPVKVDAQNIVILPKEEQLPTAKDLRGMSPDFTGDLKTEDYVRGIRE